ncbi:hypothetical protein [Microbacterium maritypicum]|uniref:hypothetical protein n=1 Tax=Microbacterium maritypicum TaxID=33918 RepID=UPI003A93B839
MRYVLRPVTAASLAAIASDWEAISGADEFQIELASAFEFARTHPDEVLDLYDTQEGRTDALVEIVRSDRASMSKLLKLWVSPQFWEISSSALRDQLVELHASSFALVIFHGMNNNMDTVKLYGRTDAMMDVLRSLSDSWDTLGITGWSSRLDGRWLAITRD